MRQKLRIFFHNHKHLRLVLLALVGIMVFWAEIEVRLQATVSSSVSAYRPDGELLWRLRPNVYADIEQGNVKYHLRTNALGLRGPDISLVKDPLAYRIVCLGDSVTFGDGVDEQYTYENQLATFLGRLYSGRKIEIINAGCPGYTSVQGRRLAESLIAQLDPDLYVVGFGYADASLDQTPDVDKFGSNAVVRGINGLLLRSEFYLLMRQAYWRSYGTASSALPHGTLVSRVAGDDFKANMKWFVDTARSHEDQVVFLNLAIKDKSISANLQARRGLAKSVADDSDSLWIDVDNMFKLRQAGSTLFRTNYLPNQQGYRVIAEALTTEIYRKGWIRK